MKPAATHAIAIAAAIAAIVATTAAWIVNLRAGPKLGLEAGAMVLIVPLALFVLAGMWFVVRLWLSAPLRWGVVAMTCLCALFAYVLVAVTCGPIACFQPGPNRAMGWFLVGGVALAALVHHGVLAWLSKPRLGGSGDNSTTSRTES
jgi:hypothetical protein